MKKLGLGVLFVFFVASAATADITWYTDQGEFEAAAATQGYPYLGMETYIENNLPAGTIMGFDDPLVSGVPNGPFPSGLTGVPNLSVQCNQFGQPAPTPNPRPPGGTGLAVDTGVFHVDDVVVANFFVDSIDHIFAGPTVGAVGYELVSLLGGNTINLEVYGPGEVLLGTGSGPVLSFLGVVASNGQQIARVNFFDPAGGAEGGDDFLVYAIPEPASALLLLLAIPLLRRR